LFIVTVRWFGLRLDSLSNLLLLATIAVSVPLVAHTSKFQLSNSDLLFMNQLLFFRVDAELNPSLLGLGLTYIVTLANMFQFCVRQSAELESQVK